MSESPQPFLISALPPNRAQKRAAFSVGLLLLALFLAVLPFAHVRLGQLEVFLPIAATIMFLTDSITATLLYAQFSVLRSRALLVLANGYLFTALVVVAYALTFPGAFAPAGLLGAGLQTSPWLFTIWHMGLPATIIAYAVLGGVSGGKHLSHSSVRTAILASIAGVIALVCGVTWFVTVHDEMLPVMVVTVTAPGGIVKIISAVMLMLSVAAFALLFFSRRSVLDLWLLVVLLAWLLSSILINFVGYRFDVAWYANRIFAIMSASTVLFVLLAESMMIYARLALSVLAQHREREGRLMTLDVLSAAIAHEIRQPLGAIVTNANAGLRWLNRASPDLNEARESFAHIGADGLRASEVIESIRAIFSRKDQAAAPARSERTDQGHDRAGAQRPEESRDLDPTWIGASTPSCSRPLRPAAAGHLESGDQCGRRDAPRR